ncbi:hypothetical protein GLAREA_04241 [Glarea lozoyensis ATCC 20868]|uniref:2EXR domain-containing protein n=1 Tax=Glarea lozoyensis (strain ATCC 20868 / MF5171) TaxID=1116229 RepID=S3CP04_GLAL2|nr:uncharacterized protein GLAREA_04241 [Glarea lozoyensis ATCC 20868]EPE27450.1 hypothetical protein GLAREA_04241 [Glarea lozoyensis ATCC 20868]
MKRNKSVALAKSKTQKCVGDEPPCQNPLKSAALVEFTLFSKLPPELKLLIWEFAFWRPRTIQIKAPYIPVYDNSLAGYLRERHPVGVPLIFHVNHETRDFANRIFEKVSSVTSTDTPTAFIHINPAIDILSLAHRGFSQALRPILEKYPAWGKTKHVAVRTPKGGWGIKLICDFFPNVEQITVQTITGGFYGDSGRGRRKWWVEKLKWSWKQKYGRKLTAKVTMTDVISLEAGHTVFHEFEWSSSLSEQPCTMTHFYENDS